jgi:hypothetical protein
MLIRHNFPVDGDYVIAASLSKSGLQAGDIARGEQLEVNLNGERVRLFDLQGGPAAAEDDATNGPSLQVKIPVKPGLQSIGVTFIAKTYAPAEDTLQPYFRSIMPGNIWTVPPHVGSVTIRGPYETKQVGDSPSRRQIFVCHPDNVQKEPACAREIVSKLARRAFRSDGVLSAGPGYRKFR